MKKEHDRNEAAKARAAQNNYAYTAPNTTSMIAEGTPPNTEPKAAVFDHEEKSTSGCQQQEEKTSGIVNIAAIFNPGEKSTTACQRQEEDMSAIVSIKIID